MKKNKTSPLSLAFIMLIFVTIGCSEKSKDPPATKANSASGELTARAKIPFEDGVYIYRSRVANGAETCPSEKEKCISFEDYRRMCLEVNSITKGMSTSISSGLVGGNAAFRKLLEAGNFDDAKGEWLDKDQWKAESGIIGACEVTLSASGIYEGTSTSTNIKVFAQEFIVDKGDVLLHRATPGSASML